MIIIIINNSVREFFKINGYDFLDVNGFLGFVNCLIVNLDEGILLYSFRIVRVTGIFYKFLERKKIEKKKKKRRI